MLNDIAKATLYISVSGSLIALVLLLLKPLIQRQVSKQWYYYAWLIVIIRLVVPYGLPVYKIGGIMYPKPDYAEASEIDTAAKSVLPTVINENTNFQLPQEIEILTQKNIDTDMNTNTAESVIVSDQKDLFDYLQHLSPFLGLIWTIAALTALVRKLIHYHNFVCFIKFGYKPIDDEDILKTYADTCQLFGIKKELPVFTHRNINSPMLIGFLKPMIVLPEKQMENIPQLKYVFMHELTHYRRIDILYKWFMQIAICIHWFNPVVYLIGKEVNNACELSCDEAVIKKLSFQEQRKYGDTLLRSLELLGGYSNNAVSLTLAENSKLMKERLGAIMHFRKKSKLAAFISALLTVVLCTGAAFSGVQTETTNNNNKLAAVDMINSSAIIPDDLQNIQPVSITTISASAYTGKWASATGIEGDTYKKQLDEKIKWVEDLYTEKKEKFLLKETISEKEITNTLGIRYMYEQSSVYRDMANTGNTFKLLPYDSSFSRTGINKFYERSVFYVDQTAIMNLSISFDLTEGRLGLMVVSPEGKIIYAGNQLSRYSDTVTLPLEKGLWSFITINESETGAIKGTQKIEGKLTLNFKGTYSTADNKDESSTSFANVNEININISQIAPDGYKSYGPYTLKEGDIISSNLEWSNDDGGVYFAIGKEFMDFKGFHSGYGNYGKSLKKDIIVQEDGVYYIFVGNPSTLDPEVKNVVGSIAINDSAKSAKQNNTDKSGQKSKISVDIPHVNEKGFVNPYGKYFLSMNDNVYADITWKGNGYVMFMYTKENLSTDDIAALINNGVLPLGGGDKFLGAGTEITSNFTYQSQKKDIVYNLTTSADEICKTMSVSSEGEYYFYVIARGDTEITAIQGEISIDKKANGSTYNIGEKLPRMNVWIGSAGEKETPTGIVYNSKNFTGDRINYEFQSKENGSKIIKFNSSLTGEYEIVFVKSDRTIIKTIPPFTGNKEITLTGLPEDTISMIVYSINVSGSLSVDTLTDVIQTSNKLADIKFISEANSYLYEGGVAANNFQYGNPFTAQKGDTVTLSLTEELSGLQLDKDKITIKIVIGGNDGTTQEVILSNKETQKTITIKRMYIQPCNWQ